MKLYKIRDFLVLAKYRFDIGMTFIVFLNFSLLIITASDNLKGYFNISTSALYMILLPIAFLGNYIFGYLLDKISKYQKEYIRNSHSRSPQIMEILESVREIKNELKRRKNE